MSRGFFCKTSSATTSPAAPIAGELLTATPSQPVLLVVDQLFDEAVVVGAHEWHKRLVRRLDRLDHRIVDSGSPNAVEMLARGQHCRHLLRGLFVGPVHEGRRNDLDPRVILENRVEARLPDAIAGRSIDAPHLIDVALAFQLIEQPLGANLGVGHLIASHDIGFRGRDGLVRRDDDDPLVGRRFDDSVQGLLIGRVDDDRVDAGRNQRAQIRDLLGRARFAIGKNDFRNQAGRKRLGFDRANELLAPAVSDMRVGDPNDELLGGACAAPAAAPPRARRMRQCR